MKYLKKLSIIIFSFILCLSFSGCFRNFDCSGYITGMLDSTYKGETADYAHITKTSEEELTEVYEQFMVHETQVFLRFCGLNEDDLIPEDLTAQITEILKHIYSQARYTVNEADRDGNVAIDIEPIDFYNQIYAEFSAFNTSFKERNNNYEFEDCTDEEFTRQYLEPLIEILDSHKDELRYKSQISMTVLVAPGEDGRYAISDEEAAALYNTVVSYSINE